MVVGLFPRSPWSQGSILAILEAGIPRMGRNPEGASFLSHGTLGCLPSPLSDFGL